jgi:hydroxypyruvate reductase
MSVAVEQHWSENLPLEGIAITRYGHGLPTRRIRVVEAGHPVPDEAGESAAREILGKAKELEADDLLLVLISGGGSSLLSLPAEGISMSDLKAVTAQLLRSGATIQEINTVRKHLSAIHGGRLAAASRAPVLALIISDVTGDDPTHIASGPCAPDPTTGADALEVLQRYRIAAPPSVTLRLGRCADETPKPGDPVFSRVENRIVASAHGSLEAAGEVFRGRRIEPVILGDTVMGEASEVAKVIAALARQIRRFGSPFRAPVALISGGECTVTVRNERGHGGRCSEFLLSLAIELDAMQHTWGIAADTDGIDGSEDNAGALIAPDTLARARGAGLQPKALLSQNDSYGFFSALGDLVVTGPTRTNVNDYRVLLLL